MAAIGRTQFLKTWLLGVALLCATSALPAQGVTTLNPTTMQFTDPAHGVSFTYPASWTFAMSQPFYMILAISPANDKPDMGPGSALIYTKSISGVAPWPKTWFEGVELGYDEHDVPTSDACLVLAKPVNSWVPIDHLDEVTIQGNHYWHGTANGAATGHGLDEDVYTSYSSGHCYRFDLAVSLLWLSNDTPGPRELTAAENALVNASLRSILNSVRIVPPAQ